MESKELCAWLRENSSGAYRPAADAADMIERLEAAATAPKAAVPDTLATIKATQHYLVDVIRSFGDVNCAAYISTWHQPDRIASAIAAATPSPVPAEPRHVRDQAEAWLMVCALLSELEPGWAGRIGTGLESALATIRNLASRPAPVAEQKPVAMVDAGDDGMFAEILPDVSVKVGQMLYAAPVAAVPEGFVIAPHYRGYAHLGTGNYLVNHSAAGEPAELVISVATDEQKAGRKVGDEQDNIPGEYIQPDIMCVRVRFENVAGLDVLENQLRYLRSVHFPSQPDQSAQEVKCGTCGVNRLAGLCKHPENCGMVGTASTAPAAPSAAQAAGVEKAPNFCAPDGTCNCAKFHDDPTTCDRRVERTVERGWRAAMQDLLRVLRGVQAGDDSQWQFITNVCENAKDILDAATPSEGVAAPVANGELLTPEQRAAIKAAVRKAYPNTLAWDLMLDSLAWNTEQACYVASSKAAPAQPSADQVRDAAQPIPPFDFAETCTLLSQERGKPVPTMCPRCKNPHHVCDHGSAAQAVDVIAAAKEAGLWTQRSGVNMAIGGEAELRRFADLVASAPPVADMEGVKEALIEQCAAICDNLHHEWKWDDEPDSDSGPRSCAKAIRALSRRPAAAAEATELQQELEDFDIERTGDNRYDASNFLLNAAQEFWQACHDAGQYGGVQWLTGTGGELLIYTRGEYRDQLMRNIAVLDCQKEHKFPPVVAAEQPAEELTPKDVNALRRWAEQIECMSSLFDDERGLLCQQVAVLMHRIAYKPAETAEQPAAAGNALTDREAISKIVAAEFPTWSEADKLTGRAIIGKCWSAIAQHLRAAPQAAQGEGLTDEQYQYILRPVLSRIGMKRYLSGDPIELHPSDYRTIINRAIAAHARASDGSGKDAAMQLGIPQAKPGFPE